MDFKSEEEVREFLTNLGIEYRFGCYSEKNPEVCHLLGDYLEVIKKEFRKSAKVYRNNCDTYNYARSCDKFGSYLMLGKGIPKKDPKTAYDYYKKGCDLNDPKACYNQAIFNLGHVKECTDFIDHKLGAANLEKSCKGNDETACQILSEIMISGSFESSGIRKDMKKAFEISKLGCDLRNINCCVNLSRMYATGDGVARNDKLAERYKNKATEILDEQVLAKHTIEFQQGI